MYFPENGNEAGNVLIDIHLRADLALNSVIAEAPIGRRGNNRLEQSFRKASQNAARVAHQDLAKIAGIPRAVRLEFVFKIREQPKDLAHGTILL